MARIDGVLLSDDLLFASKITTTARAHGLTVRVVKSIPDLLTAACEDATAGVIIDLHHSAFDVSELVAKLPGRAVTAYGSHVDVERLKAARTAGCTRVLPRSAFVEKLESDLATWLAGSTFATS
jgi:ActR/RegA family two-component response regulator